MHIQMGESKLKCHLKAKCKCSFVKAEVKLEHNKSAVDTRKQREGVLIVPALKMRRVIPLKSSSPARIVLPEKNVIWTPIVEHCLKYLGNTPEVDRSSQSFR